MGIEWGLAGSVMLSGLTIVFLILIILIATVEITGRVVKSAEKKSGPPAAQPTPVPAQKPAPESAPAPAVQTGIEEETVAVISAAVYSCLESSGGAAAYAIKSISRGHAAGGGRPVWGFAGMQHNTRPF